MGREEEVTTATTENGDGDLDTLQLTNNRLFDDGGTSMEVEEEQRVAVDYDETTANKFSFKKLAVFMGPGFLMSIAYLDPGNIESDLAAGVAAGYSLLWLLLIAHLLGFLLQCLAIRLGVVTGNHLAEVARSKFHVVPRVILWLMIEVAIIGSDMQEVIGTAIALYILSNKSIPLWGGVVLTILDTFTFLFLDKYGLRKLEAFFAFLIATMAIMFGFEYFNHLPDQVKVLEGFVPGLGAEWTSDVTVQAVGMIGAVIMPHNFYLHSALVRSREVNRSNKGAVKEATWYNSIESGLALICSFVINLFVMCVFANAWYYSPDLRDKCSNGTSSLDLYTAAGYLSCSFGSVSKYIWAIGILAAGQSSTMTGTYSGQFVMEGFVNLRLPRWQRVLLTRSIAILPTLILVISSSSSVDKLSSLNDILNILQSIMLPFAIFPMIQFTKDRRIMGSFKTSRGILVVVWLLALLIVGINVYLVVQTVIGYGLGVGLEVLIGIVYFMYSLVVLYFLLCALGVRLAFLDRLFPPPTLTDRKEANERTALVNKDD